MKSDPTTAMERNSTSPSAKRPSFRAGLPRMVLALAIGTCGGTLFHLAGLPLPWMLGAMLATAVAAFSGVELAVDNRVRVLMMIVLGTLLGSAFSPEILQRATEWPISMLSLVGYIVMASLMTFWFYHRVAGIDSRTAFFSGVPGGLAEMITLGHAAGGDDRKISLAHTTRIFLVVMSLPLAFRLFGDFDTGARARAGTSIFDIEALDVALLTASGIVGFALAKLLRIPAPQMTGPMFVSAAVHLSGLTSAAPPFLVVAIAQVIIGSAVGSRFSGLRLREVARYLWLGAVSTVMLLSLTILYALALEKLMDVPFGAFVLAFSPGGLTEMSLVALAMHIDTAFVATHHMVRIFIVVALTPHMFRVMDRFGFIKEPKP
jgi:uncharacterized protein